MWVHLRNSFLVLGEEIWWWTYEVKDERFLGVKRSIAEGIVVSMRDGLGRRFSGNLHKCGLVRVFDCC